MIPSRYTRTAMVLHWTVAVLICVNVLLMWVPNLLPDSFGRPLVDMHKSIGITVLGLVLIRILWRATHRPPALPASYAKLERRGAHAAHIALYVLILAMPLSGWLHDSAWKAAASHPLLLFGFIPWFRIGAVAHLDPAFRDQLHSQFGALHTYLSYVLYALFAAHVLGALKHQFLDREPELQRMLPGPPEPHAPTPAPPGYRAPDSGTAITG